MKGSITLDPKHGLNPSVFHCFYCGAAVGVALFGRLPDGSEAPHDCGVLDMTPCHECAEYMTQGVILISCRDSDVGSDNPYRTGGFVVARDEFIQRAVTEPLQTQILKERFAFVPDSAWDLLGLPRAPRPHTDD